jgi:hypothetical protein
MDPQSYPHLLTRDSFGFQQAQISNNYMNPVSFDLQPLPPQ